jgi:hypothetical protein
MVTLQCRNRSPYLISGNQLFYASQEGSSDCDDIVQFMMKVVYLILTPNYLGLARSYAQVLIMYHVSQAVSPPQNHSSGVSLIIEAPKR